MTPTDKENELRILILEYIRGMTIAQLEQLCREIQRILDQTS